MNQNNVPQNSIKVLLINDEIFILEILTSLLIKEQINDIDIAYNGFEGYNKVI
jgi:YesN/AraC family two-component response regulator